MDTIPKDCGSAKDILIYGVAPGPRDKRRGLCDCNMTPGVHITERNFKGKENQRLENLETVI